MQILPGNSVEIIPIIIFAVLCHCFQNKETFLIQPKIYGSFLKIPESAPTFVLSTPMVESLSWLDASFFVWLLVQLINPTRMNIIKKAFIVLLIRTSKNQTSGNKKSHPVDTERPLTIACHMKKSLIKSVGKRILTY